MKQGMNSVAATVLGGMLTFALASSAAMAAEQRIGAVVQPDYSGATALANGAADAHAIRYRDDVHALDTVETGAKGSTSLEFLDETRIFRSQPVPRPATVDMPGLQHATRNDGAVAGRQRGVIVRPAMRINEFTLRNDVVIDE